MENSEIKNLIRRAEEARERAYAPYSGFKVGAALLAGSGEIYTGVNVENKSYGLTVCAERNAIFTAVGAGERKIAAIAVTADLSEPVTPCGACREVMMEFADEKTIVIMANIKGDYKVVTAGELLPFSFILK